MPIRKDTTKIVQVVMPKDHADNLAKEAAKAGISVSALIRKRIKSNPK